MIFSELKALLAAARANTAPLSSWEADFLRDIEQRGGVPTAKQVAVLKRIADRASVDFASVNRAARHRAEDVCRRLLPGGARHGAYWAAGDLTGAQGKSLRVRLAGDLAGAWIDNATGDKGGDFVSLAAAVARLSQSDAAQQLMRMLGMEGGTDER